MSLLISFLSYLGYQIAEPNIKFCKVYRIIHAIQLVSGWAWDDETGASITVDSASSWEDYVKKHPEAKPFQNNGWPLFCKVVELMPLTPTGANVFHQSASQDQSDGGDASLTPKADLTPAPPVITVQKSVDAPIELSDSETEVSFSLSYFIFLFIFSDL